MGSEKLSLQKILFKTIEEATEYYDELDTDLLEENSSILIENDNLIFIYSRGVNDDKDFGELKWRSIKTVEQTFLSPTVAKLFKEYIKAQMIANIYKKNCLDIIKVVYGKSVEKGQILAYGDETIVIINSIEDPFNIININQKEWNEITEEMHDEQ